MPESSPLPVLQAGGFTASVDAFAWEPDPDPAQRRMRLWFLSLLGPREAVRALWARLVKGETALVSAEALGGVQFCVLAPEGPRRWRFVGVNLRAAGGWHGLLVPEAALVAADRADFLLLPRRPDEAPRLHARFLARRLDLPLHPSWSDWLWERARRTGEATVLESHGCLAYRCLPDSAALARDIGAAIRAGTLAVPTELDQPLDGHTGVRPGESADNRGGHDGTT